jgi:hypothetical protein
MFRSVTDYFQCPPGSLDFGISGTPAGTPGYFRFGTDTICYGRNSRALTSTVSIKDAPDLLEELRFTGHRCLLPFDADEVMSNLRLERYHLDEPAALGNSLVKKAYYLVRPLLPVSIRKHLQRASVRARESQSFPTWPIDVTADNLARRLAACALRSNGSDRVPFIWFWPDGHSSCTVMTHDVETAAGRDFCSTLMDIDDRFGVKSSFQVVPEERYQVSAEYLKSLTSRGFEVNVHDLNHDGKLFREEGSFNQRIAKVNAYGKQFGSKGFRSGALYHNVDWFSSLHFSYDMSVANSGRLEAQPGGCCTVMPYFIGDILEIPVTMTQDYALFNYLNTFSVDLWKSQLQFILKHNGLANFIVHPDYIIESKARDVYVSLLQHLSELRSSANMWLALPGEVDTWWRQRAKMNVRREADGWMIEGEASDRAKLAYMEVPANNSDSPINFYIEDRVHTA